LEGVLLDRKNVLRVISIFACALFIVSTSLPFLQAHIDAVGNYSQNEFFWSFKENYELEYTNQGGVRRMQELWFADYWSRGWSYSFVGWVGPFLIFTFEAQVFTILFAALAILKVKPYLFLSSTILNIFTIFCMGFVGYTLDSNYLSYTLNSDWVITFQAGFWFTLPSVTLFFIAFLKSWKLQRKETTRQNSQQEPSASLFSDKNVFVNSRGNHVFSYIYDSF
jgi:hypothetical protein